MTNKNEYVSRINKVIDYIDRNISDEFTLSGLSKIACFSKYHFHRIFYSLMNETLFQFIQRIRVEKSAAMLASHPDLSVTDIALQCGFSGSAIFSRTFRDYYKTTPSNWREKKNGRINIAWTNHELAGKEIPDYSRFAEYKKDMIIWKIAAEKDYYVEVKDFPETTVAYIRHIGPYKEDLKLFEKLYSKLLNWAGPRGLVNEKSIFLNVYHDNPDITDDDKLRLSVCMNIPDETNVTGETGKMVIASGKYAFARFILGDMDYRQAWDWVYSKWLPQSGFQPDDGFAFELMVGKDDNTDKHIVDICIPVKPL